MKIKYNFNFPQKAMIEEVYHLFKKENHQLYLVGGAVRSLLMKQSPNDLDFTTSALPSQVKNMFKTVILTGIEHGTVTVIWKKTPLEITTFRTDGDYLDQRRPSKIKYISSLEEDLSRRDFTINALAYDLSENYLFDYFQGKEDIENKIIRAIGVPSKRFSEDALRILRACRFASQLNFTIEKDTLKAMKGLSQNLKKISVERVYNELVKIINSSEPTTGLNYLEEINFFELFNLPIRNKELEIWTKINLIDKNYKMERLYLFFNPFSLKEAERFMELMKFPNYYKKPILWIKKIVSLPSFSSFLDNDYENRVFLNRLGREYIDSFLLLEEFIVHDNQEILKAKEIINKNKNKPLNLRELDITGDDLLTLGFKGKEVGENLNKCLEIVLKNPNLNEKEVLLEELLKKRNI